MKKSRRINPRRLFIGWITLCMLAFTAVAGQTQEKSVPSDSTILPSSSSVIAPDPFTIPDIPAGVQASYLGSVNLPDLATAASNNPPEQSAAASPAAGTYPAAPTYTGPAVNEQHQMPLVGDFKMQLQQVYNKELPSAEYFSNNAGQFFLQTGPFIGTIRTADRDAGQIADKANQLIYNNLFQVPNGNAIPEGSDINTVRWNNADSAVQQAKNAVNEFIDNGAITNVDGYKAANALLARAYAAEHIVKASIIQDGYGNWTDTINNMVDSALKSGDPGTIRMSLELLNVYPTPNLYLANVLNNSTYKNLESSSPTLQEFRADLESHIY